jgi:uncharacterized protein YaaW (UPF0174 family)
LQKSKISEKSSNFLQEVNNSYKIITLKNKNSIKMKVPESQTDGIFLGLINSQIWEPAITKKIEDYCTNN